MRPILQSEAAECGIACLAMIANHHGHHVDLASLRQKFGSSLKGATLKDLMTISDALDFSSRAIRVELKALSDLALPAVLHWDMSHFVVVKSVTPRHITILDPARGERKLTHSAVSKHFTGIALELTPAKNFKPIKARISTKLSSLWGKITGLKRSLIQILVLSLIGQFFVLASPFYLQLVIDEAVVRIDRDFLFVLAMGFGALYVINSFTQLIRSWVILLLGQSMTFQMAGNVLRHLLRLPSDFFEKRHVGDIMSRIGSIQPIKSAMTEGVIAAILDGGMAITTVILMLIFSWKLTLIAVSMTLLYLAFSLLIFPFMRSRQEDMITVQAKEQSHVIESVRAARAVKLFGREMERESAWRNLYSDFINASLSLGKFNVGNEFISSTIAGLQTVVIVYAGALQILAGEMTIGVLFAFMAYRQNFSDRADALVNKGIEFRMLGLHLERLSDIVQTGQEVGLDEPISEMRSLKGDLSLEQVSFRYSPNEPFIFENLDLDIKTGEFIAIAGPSGGGKTTMMKVMLGLLQVEAGRVSVDGLPLSTYGLRNMRSSIGVVMQDDQLLSGTIADNISFFDPEVDMDRVRECARTAQVHDDITRMPMNYLSLIGDMGAALSGGQRQRLLLARALYHQPKMLFLDEGTANLDEQSERQIADIIADMPITRIIIAHRPALIQRADRVFIMRGGQVLERINKDIEPAAEQIIDNASPSQVK